MNRFHSPLDIKQSINIVVLHFVRFPLNLKKVACLIQDVVSPHCGDKRMARCCTGSSLLNYFFIRSYHWNAGKHVNVCNVSKAKE